MIVSIKPIITEKSLFVASKGWYTFATDRFTRKEDIRASVEKIFGVNVTSIRTSVRHGKIRRVGRKMISVEKPDWKKALVQLKEGQKIDAFDVIPEQTQVAEKK